MEELWNIKTQYGVLPVINKQFDVSHYVFWNIKRLNAIEEHYGINFFKNKTVLEIGCGWAAIGNEISNWGAQVTVSDARKEHLEEVRRRYPHLKTHLFDLENSTEWTFPKKHYDVIIHFGVLYHLSDPESNLKFMTKHCEHMILETEVLDSNDPYLVKNIKEETEWDKGSWGMAYSGVGSKPSYAFVERVLKESKMVYEEPLNPKKVNAGDHNYDWERKNTGEMNKVCQRSFWFCRKQ